MDAVRATVRVFAIPPPRDGEYDFREWPRISLFSCLLTTGKQYIANDQSTLAVRLETFSGELIGVAPYDGEYGVAATENSVKHFAIILQNHDLRAAIGIAFVDRSDSIDFSLALQSFARIRRDAERMAQDGWASRMLSSAQSRSRHGISPAPGVEIPDTVPKLAPPGLDTGFVSRFGDSDEEDDNVDGDGDGAKSPRLYPPATHEAASASPSPPAAASGAGDDDDDEFGDFQ